ncbi:hypothetical protein GIB67_012442 [Kingdonia uniflora]|uniref:F-box domain-containing protein n=1 Tax=Kingdonia uniflora TaxID=39325 RepID=A0A7J7MTN1_9MAGN|nr:hypothetical protein GIB67_041192 [Kingdonia uniflora]KAF6162058.1 hypothetical protein GIB67_012442 [Kingdonia uniflora]
MEIQSETMEIQTYEVMGSLSLPDEEMGFVSNEEMARFQLETMESLPDAVLQEILTHIKNSEDIAACNCVSKRWNQASPFIPSLYFPRSIFDRVKSTVHPDTVISRMIYNVKLLQELIIYCPFSSTGLFSWLSATNRSLRYLELKMDSLVDKGTPPNPSKLDCIEAAKSLESLKLWGVLIMDSPKWSVFEKICVLEIVGAKVKDDAISDAIKACPNLNELLLLACDGVQSISIDLQRLEKCRLDFHGAGNCSLTLKTPNLQSLDVQGCSFIQVQDTHRLSKLSISNISGRVNIADFGKLGALKFLSIRGVQWSWVAVNSILRSATEVKHLFMKIEFTGDSSYQLQPFPEVDFVEFFNYHPNLLSFEIHGAMFAALSHRNSLRNVDSRFVIPCLENVVITVRSPLNAEQKMNTLETLVKYGKNLKSVAIKILQMKTSHSSSDDFFEEICRFKYMNQKLVRIE